MKKRVLGMAAGLVFATLGVQAGQPPRCKQQTVEKLVAEMCVLPGANAGHDTYTLKVGGAMILALVDDYAESVQLKHTIPEGVSMEFPLSRQGGKTVAITGGCVPESRDGLEVARLCNFFWGTHQVVTDVRFEFE